LTGDPETCGRLALVRGVLSLPLPASSQDPEEMIEVARRAARERGWPDMRALFVSHDRLWTDGSDGLRQRESRLACWRRPSCADARLDRLPARLLELAPGDLLH
jgi:hypothetical protein